MVRWSVSIVPLKSCLFSSPAEAEKVWGNKKQSLKTVYTTFWFERDMIAILITLIRQLMFIGDRAKAGLSLPIDFTSKAAYNNCNYLSSASKTYQQCTCVVIQFYV